MFVYSDTSNMLSSSNGLMKMRAEYKNRIFNHNAASGASSQLKGTKLPYLKESMSNPLVDIVKNSPYKGSSPYLAKLGNI